MAISYKKLWKLLIDHQMKKSDLFRVAEISGYTATKLNKDEPVIRQGYVYKINTEEAEHSFPTEKCEDRNKYAAQLANAIIAEIL